MKKTRLHATGKATLAASFVITSSLGGVACRKQNGSSTEDVSVFKNAAGCFMSVPSHCPPMATCNPPPPPQVDCPADMRDAGAAPTSARRPAGKESWLRVTPMLWSGIGAGKCSYQPEYFCSPRGSVSDCTTRPPNVDVACTTDQDAGVQHVASFVYKDGLGECRKVPATDCKPGDCRGIPDGDVVPCQQSP